jgi:beta-galactosidase
VETHRRSQFSSYGLTVRTSDGGTNDVPMYAGALDYWRVDPDCWAACLASLARLGFRLVDTCVPWNVHEPQAGTWRWTGAHDLRRFVEAAAAAGLQVVVRPGPLVNAELLYVGLPERIVRDPACLAVTSRNTPAWLPAPPRMVPLPSYASRRFQAEATRWLGAVAEQIEPYQAPDGPVVAIRIDLLLVRLGAYDLDYHPDALAWWTEFAGEIEPPTAWDPQRAALCARWVEFKEYYAARALAWISTALDQAGLGEIARLHSAPPAGPDAVPLCRLATAVDGIAGHNMHFRARDWRTWGERARLVAGSAPLPVAPELGCGGPPWLTPATHADQRAVALGVLAAGIRGFGAYMAVERERWYGAAVASDGTVADPGRFFQQLLAALTELDWPRLHRAVSVGLVATRADARYALASSVVDPLPPTVIDLVAAGPGGSAEFALDEEARQHRRWYAAVRDALDRADISWIGLDQDCAAERFAAVDLLVMPTIRRVDRGCWAKVCAAVQAGTRMIIGPGKPVADEYEKPLGGSIPRGVGRFRRDGLRDPEGLVSDLIAAANQPSSDWRCPAQAHIGTELFCTAAGQPAVLFVSNRSGTPTAAQISWPAGYSGRDGLTGAPADAPHLAGFEVRMLRIVSSPAP